LAYKFEVDDKGFEFNIEQYDENLFSRQGTLKINGKKIETPLLWLGHVIGGVPLPWREFEIETLIVNAYDILRNKKASETISEDGIHRYLDFKGSILMDSGGFLFQKKEIIDIKPSAILELYKNSCPDIGVILDHPLNPAETKKNNLKRWDLTLKNTEFMLQNKCKSNITNIMPVVHGYDLKQLKIACKNIKKLTDPKIIGIGSLVPLLFRNYGLTKKFKEPVNFIIDAVELVRSEFPDAVLHAFGVGSTKTMHLMYALGVDSIDSTGWRIKAAYGVIQLPGIADRHVKDRNNGRPFLSDSEIELLGKCECPSCRDSSIKERMDLLDKNFQARATHNAWVFVNEQKKFKKQLQECNTEEFVKSRLENGFLKAYNHLINKKRISPLNLF